MTKIPYHSALAKGKLEEAAPLSGLYLDTRNNACFVWDIVTDEIPDLFYECDLVYAEPAFPAGLKAFDQRAGRSTLTYSQYATAFGDIIRKLDRPTVLFIPPVALKFTPPPDYTTEADLNGNRTLVGFWNGAMAMGTTNKEIILTLAERYDRVGDFAAGYGTTGRLFIEAGRNCVLSDYNAQCCGYIAENMEGWG